MATATIIEITDADISNLFTWTFEIINQLKPLWVPIVGVLLGITIFAIILSYLRRD